MPDKGRGIFLFRRGPAQGWGWNSEPICKFPSPRQRPGTQQVLNAGQVFKNESTGMGRREEEVAAAVAPNPDCRPEWPHQSLCLKASPGQEYPVSKLYWRWIRTPVRQQPSSLSLTYLKDKNMRLQYGEVPCMSFWAPWRKCRIQSVLNKQYKLNYWVENS